MENKTGPPYSPTEPATAAPTPAQAGVYTTPRPAGHPRTTFEVSTTTAPPPTKRGDIELLFPRWFTLASRTVFTAFDVAVLVITLRFLAKWDGYVTTTMGHPFPASQYSVAVATVAVALFIDPLAVIASAAKRYGTYRVWVWAIMFDSTVGVLGVCTPLLIAWRDRNGFSEEELGWVWEGEGNLIGTLACAVG